MHYLIDGHNLIFHTPGLSLEEPHAPIELLLRLRSWATRSKGKKKKRGRQATLFFDRGSPGGRSPTLSNSQIEVIFAPSGRTADDLIIGRLRAARQPKAITVVSSDGQLAAAARERGVAVVPAEEFVRRLAPPPQPAAPAGRGTPDDLRLSPAEVAEWQALFEAAKPATGRQ
ncbi:MAG: NYN domain-containing protein [Candidatus Promineifilaceae bacterium]